MRSYSLVFSQFFLILLMTLPLGEPVKFLSLGLFIIALGAIVGVLALRKNTLGNFNIRPDIKGDCVLVTSGIYAYIRHPMYTSVLVMMAGVVVLYPTRFEYILYGLLVLVLLLKLFYEESLWKCESQEYLMYCKNTKRLIPFIY